MFLDNTLNGIIKRFEDEFPDTRISADSAVDVGSSIGSSPRDEKRRPPADPDLTLTSATAAAAAASISDDNEETAIKSPALSRSNSLLSLNSKALADEEGRVLRAGHKFRSGILADLRSEHYELLTSPASSAVEMIGADPNHARLLHELLEELSGDGDGDGDGDEEAEGEGRVSLARDARERGVVRVFQERRAEILERLRAADPLHWDRFVESQAMARANAVKPSAAQEQERERVREQVLEQAGQDQGQAGSGRVSEEAVVD